jgi:hypothetical protein
MMEVHLSMVVVVVVVMMMMMMTWLWCDCVESVLCTHKKALVFVCSKLCLVREGASKYRFTCTRASSEPFVLRL